MNMNVDEIDKLIKKMKIYHSITMFMMNVAIFFMLAFNVFAVAFLMGWL